jgi:hypothetical protein
MNSQRYKKLSPNDVEYISENTKNKLLTITHAGVTNGLSHIK